MAQLPLRTRRLLARGISPRIARAWGNRVFYSKPGNIGGRAAATIGTGNSSFVIYAVTPGTAGNSLTFTIVNGGTAPVVTVSGNAITVTTPVASTTVLDLEKVLNRDIRSDAAGRPVKLVRAQRAPASDGSGFVSAVGPVTLTGGAAGQ